MVYNDIPDMCCHILLAKMTCLLASSEYVSIHSSSCTYRMTYKEKCAHHIHITCERLILRFDCEVI